MPGIPINVFQKLVKGKNFMTPTVLKFEVIGDYIYELSTGTGISDEPIWGVTVVNWAKHERCNDLSGVCMSLAEVKTKVAQIGKVE